MRLALARVIAQWGMFIALALYVWRIPIEAVPHFSRVPSPASKSALAGDLGRHAQRYLFGIGSRLLHGDPVLGGHLGPEAFD